MLMRKDIGKFSAVYPMPVLMIAAYDADGKVQIMNAAWGMASDRDKLALVISEGHKTTKCIRESKAFTVSLADAEHVEAADFFGIASGNTMSDKFERAGLTAVKSEHVNAPIISEFPLAMECELAEIVKTDCFYSVIGKIVNVSADEKVLGEDGKVDVKKLNALIFDQFSSSYFVTGEKAGEAWGSGKKLM